MTKFPKVIRRTDEKYQTQLIENNMWVGKKKDFFNRSRSLVYKLKNKNKAWEQQFVRKYTHFAMKDWYLSFQSLIRQL